MHPLNVKNTTILRHAHSNKNEIWATQNDYNTNISIVLPRALEKYLSNVILRLHGSGSKHPHILAIQAHYQWQPDHIINRCLQLNSMGGAAATTTRGAGCRETLAALDRRV